MPAAGGVRYALAHHSDYRRSYHADHADHAAGFDIGAVAGFVRVSQTVPIGSEALTLISAAEESFRFDFSASAHPASSRREHLFEADRDGEVNGLAQWIRLELDERTVLEASPEPGAIFFSGPRFFPFAKPAVLRKGDRIRVAVGYDGKDLRSWVA